MIRPPQTGPAGPPRLSATLLAFTLRRRTPSLVIVLLQVVLGSVLVACQAPPSCAPDEREYNGRCLSVTAVTYMECTKGRGFNLDTEVGGKLGGTFKVVADASVEAAVRTSQTENQVVSLQIVSDCLRIAESSAASPAERSAAEESRRAADNFIAEAVKQTAHIDITPSQAAEGKSVSVRGRNFYPGETVAIRVHATLVKQMEADGQGSFATTIVVPKNAPPPGFPTTISATGETSAKSAEAPFEVTGAT